jgi:hypothetical protein
LRTPFVAAVSASLAAVNALFAAFLAVGWPHGARDRAVRAVRADLRRRSRPLPPIIRHVVDFSTTVPTRKRLARNPLLTRNSCGRIEFARAVGVALRSARSL